MRLYKPYFIGSFIVACIITFSPPSIYGQVVHTRTCNQNNTTVCNPSPNNYYAQSTATPVPMVTIAYTNSPFPAPNVQGRFAEVVDPQSDSILHVTSAIPTLSNIQHIMLGEYNLRTNTFIGQAQIESLNCATSGAPHDWAGFIPGPNGEMGIPFGGISQGSRPNAFTGCASGANMCGGTQAAPNCAIAGTTGAWGQGIKFAFPTAPPSTVASSTQYYANLPDNVSEIWSVCFQILPGDPNTWANEARRCLWGGQVHDQNNTLNGGLSTNWISQVAGTMHWGSGLMTPYEDAQTSVTVANNCPASGKAPNGTTVTATSWGCFDPINQAISSTTTGTLHITGAATDNTWQVWAFSSITTTNGTTVTFQTPTTPNTGEPNANSSCTLSEVNGASETAVNVTTDLSNAFNGNTVNGPTTGGSLTTNCSTWRTNYTMYSSPNAGSSPFNFTGSCTACGLTYSCTAANPCLILVANSNSSYTANTDLNSTLFAGNWSSNTATCTNCAAASTSTSGATNQHNTIGNCRLYSWYGEEGVCFWGVDHAVRGPYSSTTPAGTGYAQALMLMCFNRNSYTVAIPPTWTFRTCDINSGSTAASFTVSAGNGLPNINPANSVSPSIAQGNGLSATCSISPWLVCNPVTTTGTVNQFIFDWNGWADPAILNSRNFPATNAWDITYISKGFFAGDFYAVMPQGNDLSGTKRLVGCVIDTHVSPIATPRCDQIDVGVTFTGSQDNMTTSINTGASGLLYLFVQTGSGSAHGCTNTCIIEYTADPSVTTTNTALTWNFSKTVNANSGCTATASAGGLTAVDQEGGYHAISTQTCAVLPTGATQNVTTIMYDNITPRKR